MMLENREKGVCDNRESDLYGKRVVCCGGKFVYVEMVVEGFEEEVD